MEKVKIRVEYRTLEGIVHSFESDIKHADIAQQFISEAINYGESNQIPENKLGFRIFSYTEHWEKISFPVEGMNDMMTMCLHHN